MTSIFILVGNKVVGAVKSLDITAKTNQESITSVNITASGVRFDRQKVAEAFARGFIHTAEQTLPFQIEINEDGVKTKIQNVWIEGEVSTPHNINDLVEIDKIEFIAENIKKYQ